MRWFTLVISLRRLFGGCVFSLLLNVNSQAQDVAWRIQASAGPSLGSARFVYRTNVPGSLSLPARVQPALTLAMTRELTEHFALGAETRVTGLDYAVRYAGLRTPASNQSTASMVDGLLYQSGLNGQLLLPLGLRWELAAVANGLVAVSSLSVPNGDNLNSSAAVIWQPGSSSDGQSLLLHNVQPRELTILVGAEARLIYWLGGGMHGLVLTAGHQQSLRTLVRIDSQEFSYLDANGQRQRGEFGLRLPGSYSSVHLGYCYALRLRPKPKAPRWRTPRYSELPTPADDTLDER